MATWLRQSTAVDIALGPFVDSTDGVTAETALTIAQADVRLKKNNGNWAQKTEATSATHEENGWYEVPLDATDTGTLGILIVAVNESGALPVWREFLVLPANIYDSLVSGSASDYLQVDVAQLGGSAISQSGGLINANVTQISGDSVAADNLEAAADGTTYNLGGGAVVAASVTGAVGSVTGAVGSVTGNVGGNVVGSVGSVTGAVGSVTGNVGGDVVGSVGTVNALAAGAITAAAIATNAIDADALAADAVAEIQSGLATAAALATVDDFLDTEVAAILAAVDTEVAAIKAKTDNLPASPAAVGSQMDLVNAPNATAITAIQNGLATAAALATVDDFVDTEVAAILAAVDTEVAAIKAKTDNLPAAPAATGDIPTAAAIADQVWDEAIAGHLGAGSTGAALNAAGSAGDPWATVIPGAYGAGTAGKILGDNINAPIATVDTVVDAIKAKTDNLPASPAAVGSQMDLVNAPNATAVTAIQNGLATAAALTAVDDYVDTEMAAVKAVTDKLDTAVELDGAVYRFTTNALEQAPTGSAPTVVQIRQEMDVNSTKLANLDATVSSRLATAGYTAPPTANAVADQVWDEAIAGHAGAGSTGAALAAATAPSAAAVADAVWDEGLAGHGLAGSTGAALSAAGAGAGVGSVTFDYTVTDSITLLPVADCTVWATTDLAGLNRVAQGITDSFGTVRFYLDPGTYYFWRAKTGYSGVNPDTEVVV